MEQEMHAADEVQQEQPQEGASVDNMTEEEFSAYIETAKQGAQDIEGAQAHTQQEQPQEPKEEPPFRSFQTEEELQEFQNEAVRQQIQELHDQYNPYMEQLGQLTELAKGYYGEKNGKTALEQLLADLQAQSAERDGKSVEEYLQQKELERDAKAYRQQQEAQQKRQQEVGNICREWERQERVLKTIVPGFSLRRALSDKAFYKRVVEDGYSISEAYMAQDAPGRITGGENQTNTPRRRIIQEAGAQAQARQGVIRQDAKNMTDNEFEEYIRRIQNG
ncbi:MAG TPA: hypothetical protein IAB04_05490 [Candidatus Avimonoglobus intestinipullorum]|uniref:Uncharacterized protein n=1 Tax=Candidatus Avimonoglobus intestinipullorum TaxID=2840699 RepID=A0A9D1LVN9_9FIRM|nr:hypothetical protein [Candidatus Avimonoglobus intestinipullorum]